MRKMVILRDRFDKLCQDYEAIVSHREVEGQARINALKIVAELAAAVVRMHREVPARVAAYRKLYFSSSSSLQEKVVARQQQKPQLHDKKQLQQPQQDKSDYDDWIDNKEEEEDEEKMSESDELSPKRR
jgi:hypothetical protein